MEAKTGAEARNQTCYGVYRHSLNEFFGILGIWIVFCLWVVGYSSVYGYRMEGETALIGGVPGWVFWGIAMPWMAANLVTIGFCVFVMKDDPLGEEEDAVPGEAGKSRCPSEY